MPLESQLPLCAVSGTGVSYIDASGFWFWTGVPMTLGWRAGGLGLGMGGTALVVCDLFNCSTGDAVCLLRRSTTATATERIAMMAATTAMMYDAPADGGHSAKVCGGT